LHRDHRWPRVERAWRAIVDGQGQTAPDAATALARARAQGLTDEFLTPTVIDAPHLASEEAQTAASSDLQPLTSESAAAIQPEDGIVLFNFRADRMRQLLTALTSPNFDGFARPGYPEGGYDVVTMTRYLDDQNAPVAFRPFDVEWPLARVVAEAGRRQFHAAETEKYAHVTYFINGGGESPFAGEERCMIPSPDVATYDLRPQMSAEALTDALVQRIREGSPTQGGARDDLIVVNYANPDMVGHTGSIPAAVQAVETVDACLGRLLEALHEVGGIAFVTADHGNAEQMIDPATGGPHTAHTTNPVAFIVVGLDAPVTTTPLTDGRLADVAPTLLALLGLKAPPSMTGRVLLPSQMLPSMHPVTRTEPALDKI
jgi:2,3-bisphosphoglycerate-independent phosphoglycerate mutase